MSDDDGCEECTSGERVSLPGEFFQSIVETIVSHRKELRSLRARLALAEAKLQGAETSADRWKREALAAADREAAEVQRNHVRLDAEIRQAVRDRDEARETSDKWRERALAAERALTSKEIPF